MQTTTSCLATFFNIRITKPIKKVKGDELLNVFRTPELWSAIFDDDALRVCLLLVATIVFLGRESRTLYLRTLNVVPRKNERDLKKKKKVQETPKKKKKTYNFYGFVLSLKPLNLSRSDAIQTFTSQIQIQMCESDSDSEPLNKQTAHSFDIYIGDVHRHQILVEEGPDCDPTWSKTAKFEKGDYSRLFAQWLNHILTFGEVVAQVIQPEPKLIFSTGHNAKEHVQAYANIRCDVVVEDQNVPYLNIDKENLFVEFDATKATIEIIEKRKGDGNVGFDNMLESVYKDEQVDDKGEKGLVKLDDILMMEENISDVKVETKKGDEYFTR
ncbi:hypothetical protein Tco_0942628 [Tanacetum coccineum]